MEPQAISSDLIRGHIDTIILHTLLDSDKFAQQISDAIEEKSEKEYKINQATLYSSLKRLESLKYVVGYWNDSDGGGRRKFFKLTESGKNTVESNLSSWSFSRAIIDKLMDCTPKQEIKFIEKIVEVKVPVKETEPIPQTVSPVLPIADQIPLQQSQNKEKQIDQLSNNDKKLDQAEQKDIKDNNEPIQKNNQTNESTPEVNFRNILNGLIKATVVQKNKPEETILEPIDNKQTTETIDVNPPQSPKLDFNETINQTDYNSNRTNNGKVDYGDLALKAAKEGYKLRISSKDSFIQAGTLLINKLKMTSSLVMFLITMIEFLLITFFFKQTIDFTNTVTITVIIVSAIFPIVNVIKYLHNPKKSINKEISSDSILTVGLIVFNLIFINVAAVLLFGLELKDLYNTLLFLIIPITLFVDILIYFILKFTISKLKAFHYKGKMIKK